MEWNDSGVILAVRKHSEYDAIITVISEEHGKHSALVKGGNGRRLRGVLQVGNYIDVNWQGRLETFLGRYEVELRESYSAYMMHAPIRLTLLNAMTNLIYNVLPEGQKYPSIYEGMLVLFNFIKNDSDEIEHMLALYIRWELGMLSALGFGLDLTCCAGTGDQENLIYVSPKSGRAVSQEAGYPYRDKLLSLPPFLNPNNKLDNILDMDHIRDGLRLTEYFIDRYLFAPHNKNVPEPRHRLTDYCMN